MSLNKAIEKFKILGPGLIYAGAAIGVSHLVQSTRAGALYSFDLLIFVFLANFLKLPFLEMAVRYPATSGKSLLDGYRDLGRPYLLLFFVMTILTMLIIEAAIVIVTAGITLLAFPELGLSPVAAATLLLVVSGVILVVGKYGALDSLTKYIVIALSLATIIAATLALREFEPESTSFTFQYFDFFNRSDLMFLIAFIGWMPAPVDISAWHSLWYCERNNWQPANEKSVKDSYFDFYVGYIGTAVLAVFFLMLGALVMHASGENFSPSAVSFAGQLVELFSKNLGSWSKSLITFACLATMISTTLTCLDAFPRVLSRCFHLTFETPEKPKSYMISLVFVIAGTALLLFLFLENMRAMVDFATTISFLVTPIIGYMNYLLFKKIKNTKTFNSGKYVEFLDKLTPISLLFFSIFVLIYFLIKFF
ncbi:MAG: divalent metal cation transporter [Halobacteriovoraceae bacterium]|nr:divalent metal cation transporter [Halobacteriovoraceae bacterium]MCB9094147.1 divalent metal cation transporter [Halobacteriovoraceae bacterium]